MERVLVVGGGVAGVVVATHLGRRLGKRGVAEILLVDKNPAHVWKPMLHTFAAGTANYSIENVPFISHAKRNGFHYWPGDLKGLDTSSKTVEFGRVLLPDGRSELPGRTLSYHTLVVAVGSRANDFGTPGVAQHCRFIDDIGEAERFGALLRSGIVQAIDRKEDIRIIVVGGGATGVELCAQLRQHLETLSGYATQGLPTKLLITLIETGSRLLGPFPERISRSVEAKLRQLGVDVRTGTKVVGVDQQGVILDGGERLDAKLVVWAAGVKAPDVVSRLDGLETNRKGQILVRSTLQSRADDHVFALGDCAEFQGPDGKPLPTTAQVARQQAVFLAGSLGNHLKRNRPLKEFTYTDRGSLVSLGEYAAYGTLGSYGFFRGGFIRGRMAQLAHAALYRMHLLDLNGPVNGTMGWVADDLIRAARPGIRLS